MYTHKKMKTNPEVALTALNKVKEVLSGLDTFESMEALHDILMALPKEMSMKNGQVLWPVRTAVTGKQFTPGGAIEIAYILGKDETLRRIDAGIEKLNQAAA
jgi:glutamyl-tRNA synthetase